MDGDRRQRKKTDKNKLLSREYLFASPKITCIGLQFAFYADAQTGILLAQTTPKITKINRLLHIKFQKFPGPRSPNRGGRTSFRLLPSALRGFAPFTPSTVAAQWLGSPDPASIH